ncbi:predicted protein [Sclerotinia sclerotiorum 1980 UF-70]|uniref:Uncharacterized protein n=1 Tax=Sclerotinia sclerotiorum (strain ATCC 18683 / 1980 / Ss-1) TaxID=665079 RepID=A7EPB4_SCLS1|nr:predicted protein [Sclerotinia sclerotiorum 1980 UF-70]EDO04680.1 predicted protein [Sclerotinia sclerotiorum 1980 UF-70]
MICSIIEPCLTWAGIDSMDETGSSMNNASLRGLISPGFRDYAASLPG